jgi:hypothetical protein
MNHLLYIIIVIVIVTIIVRPITRKRERAYAPRSLNGLPLLKRLGGGRRTQSRLLITIRATAGRSEAKPQSKTGKLVLEIVRGETKNKRKETISFP